MVIGRPKRWPWEWIVAARPKQGDHVSVLRFQNIHNANEHPIRLERRDKKGLHRNKRLENYVAQTQPVLLLFVVLIKFQFINQLNGDIDNIIVVGGLGPTTTHTYPMPQCARRGDRFSHIHATRARYSASKRTTKNAFRRPMCGCRHRRQPVLHAHHTAYCARNTTRTEDGKIMIKSASPVTFSHKLADRRQCLPAVADESNVAKAHQWAEASVKPRIQLQ